MRRFFEQGTVATPTNDFRIGLGKAGAPTVNITITAFIAWLNGVLTFLKPSNNLSDVSDNATSRNNIEVYSYDESDDLLDDKANIYSGTVPNGALKADNTTSFSPSAETHPATKGYVDETAGTLVTGAEVIGNIPSTNYTVTVTIPDIGTFNYAVFGTMFDDGASPICDVIWMIANRTATSFDLVMTEISSSAQDLTFHYRIYSL